ncbi:sensor histidine kinase [Alkalimarinus alittae]|uniref:histidine kinase n=1 Tax=Alkalimarinus alittae TaxID=2961619 RepID=A0ABY6N5L3_9ALTE|nr:ATP-binding protein [Alkalimarinus alittae]UZE97401.1 ATP-binding protein [Alkalimarinus alittae]
MKKSISRNITLTVCGLLVALNLVVSFVTYIKNNKDEELRFQQRALYITEIASQSGSGLLWGFEYDKLALFSEYLLDDPILSGVLFTSSSETHFGNRIIGFVKGKGSVNDEADSIEPYYPEYYDDIKHIELIRGGETIGQLFVFFDKRSLHAHQTQRIWADLIRGTLIFSVFFIAIYVVLQTQFVKPFKRSHELAKALTKKFNEFNLHIGKGGNLESSSFNDFNALIEGYSVQLNRQDEVGDFYRAFNALVNAITMILSELSQYSAQLNTLNEELEQRVKDRTQELEDTLNSLKNTQSRMVQQEKLASIGQLAAGVAHEINNPLGYISSNINRLEDYFNDISEFIDALEKQSTQTDGFSIESDSRKTFSELKAQFDYGFIKQDLPDLLKDCVEGSVRVQTIVQNLKSFSRMDDAGENTEFDINDAVNSTLKLVRNELKYNCDVEIDLGDSLVVAGHYGQINQVISNLLVNASHAIKETGKHGSVVIKTWSDECNVYLRVKDTGKGIPQSQINKIFEAFFTTKDVGKGTGLGLNISYDIIVNKHGGDISVESEVGKGTSFLITLPRERRRDDTDEVRRERDI